MLANRITLLIKSLTLLLNTKAGYSKEAQWNKENETNSTRGIGAKAYISGSY